MLYCLLQASGVSVQEKCKTEFKNIKLGHKYRYIVYRLSDDLTEVIVDKCAATSMYSTAQLLTFHIMTNTNNKNNLHNKLMDNVSHQD